MTKRGHEQPLLDNTSDSNLFNAPTDQSLAVELPADDDFEAPAEAHEQAPKPIAEIMAEHEARKAERAAREESLTNANWPPGRIKQKLDKEFPDLVTSDDVEARDKATDRQVRFRAAANGGTHPTGPRGKKHHFDDKSKSVESAYEGFGQ